MRQRFLLSVVAAAWITACGSRSELLDSGFGGGANIGAGGGSTTGGGSTAGAGGTTGGTKPEVCAPGAVEVCYSGPESTLGVGVCKAGQRICQSDGEGFGPCDGEVIPTPEDCATPADEDCNGEGGILCPPSEFWSVSLTDGDGIEVTTDSVGNVVVATFCDGLDFGGTPAGDDKFCLAKFDPFGALIWSKPLGGAAAAIRLDSDDNIWVAGYFSTGSIDVGGPIFENKKNGFDFFFVKLDPTGNYLWGHGFGDEAGGQESQFAWDVAVGENGYATVVGTFNGTLGFGGPALSTGGVQSGFVAHFDAEGIHQWSRVLKADSPVNLARVIALPGGSIVVAGNHYGGLKCGEVLSSNGMSDIFVTKLDTEGNFVFCRNFGGIGQELTPSLAAGAEGSLLLAAGFGGPMDFGATQLVPEGTGDTFVGRLSADGAPQNALNFPSTGYVDNRHLATNAAGEALLVGGLEGSMNVGDTVLSTNAGMFVVRLDALGSPAWGRTYGEGEYILAYNTAFDPSGNVLVIGGYHHAKLDFFDADSPHSTVGLSMFLAKLPP